VRVGARGGLRAAANPLLVEVSPSSPEAAYVWSRLVNSQASPSFECHRVRRVENLQLWRSYESHKAFLLAAKAEAAPASEHDKLVNAAPLVGSAVIEPCLNEYYLAAPIDRGLISSGHAGTLVRQGYGALDPVPCGPFGEAFALFDSVGGVYSALQATHARAQGASDEAGVECSMVVRVSVFWVCMFL
jgi:hypothetical protein